MHRAVIFTGSDSGAPAVLVRGALTAIDSCAGLELAGICVPVVRPPDDDLAQVPRRAGDRLQLPPYGPGA